MQAVRLAALPWEVAREEASRGGASPAVRGVGGGGGGGGGGGDGATCERERRARRWSAKFEPRLRCEALAVLMRFGGALPPTGGGAGPAALGEAFDLRPACVRAVIGGAAAQFQGAAARGGEEEEGWSEAAGEADVVCAALRALPLLEQTAAADGGGGEEAARGRREGWTRGGVHLLSP